MKLAACLCCLLVRLLCVKSASASASARVCSSVHFSCFQPQAPRLSAGSIREHRGSCRLSTVVASPFRRMFFSATNRAQRIGQHKTVFVHLIVGCVGCRVPFTTMHACVSFAVQKVYCILVDGGQVGRGWAQQVARQWPTCGPADGGWSAALRLP